VFSVLSDLSWTGFALASVASIVLAGVWFGAVIAKPYLVALGRADGPAPEADLVRQAGPVLCLMPLVLTSTWLIEVLDVTTPGDAVAFGLLVGIGYLTAMTFQIALNPNFPRPLYYGLLNAPFFVLSSVVTAAIVTAMR